MWSDASVEDETWCEKSHETAHVHEVSIKIFRTADVKPAILSSSHSSTEYGALSNIYWSSSGCSSLLLPISIVNQLLLDLFVSLSHIIRLHIIVQYSLTLRNIMQFSCFRWQGSELRLWHNVALNALFIILGVLFLNQLEIIRIDFPVFYLFELKLLQGCTLTCHSQVFALLCQIIRLQQRYLYLHLILWLLIVV